MSVCVYAFACVSACVFEYEHSWFSPCVEEQEQEGRRRREKGARDAAADDSEDKQRAIKRLP